MGSRQRAIRNKQTSKAAYRFTFTFALLLLCVVGGVSSVIGYQTVKTNYPRYLLLAQEGIQHLSMAATLVAAIPNDPFDTHTVGQARQEFAAASTSFGQLANDLQPLAGVGTFIPVYSARLYAGLHLSLIAVGISQAGVSGCDLLNVLISELHDPLNVQRRGLTMQDLSSVGQYLHRIKIALTQAIDQAKQLQPTDAEFDPSHNESGTYSSSPIYPGRLFTTFYRDIPMLEAALNNLEQLPGVISGLLGIDKPADYLLEVLDSTELRPGGGFIGNYGILTLSAGRLMAAHITDVNLLDTFFTETGHVIPYPRAYTWFRLTTHSWNLRDSNLDADFPTDARYGEQNYMQEGGTIPVLGVIAITPALIQHTLEITGPINVTEYHEVITAQNLIARIHYHELGPAGEGSGFVPSPDGYSSLRKHFTALLAEHVLARVRQLSSSAFLRFSRLLVNSIRSKDIQIYFNSSVAENILHFSHLDAAIQPSDKDSLFVVDANLGVTKANNFIVNTLNDQVTLDAEGTAVHHTTLTYAWTIPGQTYGWPTYRDYIRIYTPPGSTLDMQTGLAPSSYPDLSWESQAFGHRVWAGNFTLLYGQTHIITLVWHVPRAVTQDSSGWHYQFLVQRQAGAQWTAHLLITLPSCAVMSNQSGGLVSETRQTATLAQPLNQDLSVGIDYICR